ncbi:MULTISPECIES: hypothetical protein [unclassified Brevibacillus]|uniref:hypothetical protein n=1 Tax=unclassified Brevibacillus TaxID=2684853 RepID=UPI003562F17F
MCIVYSNDEGLDGIYTDYEEALKAYEGAKSDLERYVRENGEFSTDELVVIARIDKQFFSIDTFKPVMKEDEQGNEVDTGDTYWNFKELDYTTKEKTHRDRLRESGYPEHLLDRMSDEECEGECEAVGIV